MVCIRQFAIFISLVFVFNGCSGYTGLTIEKPNAASDKLSTTIGLPVLTGLQLWLDAQDPSTLFTGSDCTGPVVADGDPVGCWKDKSSFGSDFTNTVASPLGTRPLYNQTTRAIDFNTLGTSDYLGVANFDFSSPELTVFIVVESADSQCGLLSYASSNHNNDFLFYNPDNLQVFVGGTNRQVGNDLSSFGLISFSGQDSSNSFVVSQNGLENANAPYSMTKWYAPGGTLLLSQEQDSVGGSLSQPQACTMSLSELIVFDHSLSDVDHSMVEGYLACKWGLQDSLPNTHAYKTSCP